MAMTDNLMVMSQSQGQHGSTTLRVPGEFPKLAPGSRSAGAQTADRRIVSGMPGQVSGAPNEWNSGSRCRAERRCAHGCPVSDHFVFRETRLPRKWVAMYPPDSSSMPKASGRVLARIADAMPPFVRVQQAIDGIDAAPANTPTTLDDVMKELEGTPSTPRR
jgi:hypothetical protein